VDIKELDFDPFAVDTELRFWHTPPALLAAHLFENDRFVNWIALAARCHWIASQATAVAQKARSRPGLHDLLPELQLRAGHYVAIDQYLTRDLGISRESRESIEIAALSEQLSTEAEIEYEGLRRVYGRENKARTIESVASGGDPSMHVEQTVKEIKGSVTAIATRELDAEKATHVGFAQTIDDIEGGSLTGLEIDTVRGGWPQSPFQVRIDGEMQVGKASEATIHCVWVHRIEGKAIAWKGALRASVESLRDSLFYGVIIDDATEEPSNSDSVGAEIRHLGV
jgi:hypothetical protein